MSDPAPSVISERRPRDALFRAERRETILDMAAVGLSNRSIGRTLNLTGERVRQIVADALARDPAHARLDHQRLQMLRLQLAMRTMSEKIGKGELRAVMPYLRVLAQVDKYQGALAAVVDEYEDGHAKLMAKMERVAARHQQEMQRQKGDEEIAYNQRREAARQAAQAAPDGSGEADKDKSEEI